MFIIFLAVAAVLGVPVAVLAASGGSSTQAC